MKNNKNNQTLKELEICNKILSNLRPGHHQDDIVRRAILNKILKKFGNLK